MIGRAGRPPYDIKGIAIILTQQKNVVSNCFKLSNSTKFSFIVHIFYNILKCVAHLSLRW